MANLTDIVMPADQAEGTSNTVGKWFKAVGEAVAVNDPLLEITTDKVTVEVAAPADGVLVEILKAEGDTVEPGDVLGRVGPAGSQAAAASVLPAAAAGAAAAPGRAPAGSADAAGELTPAVRRLLKQYGIDAAAITGTGRGGRITVEDVEAFAARSTSVAAGATPAPAAGADRGASRMVPHSVMRKSIAQHMVHSMATAPHVTSVFEADLSAILAHREAHRADFEARGAKLTFTAYFVRATVAALQAVPEVNSRWHDTALELFEECHIGIGTALDAGGLIVPVVHSAQRLDLFGTAERLQDLTARARAGKLEPKDVQGGTFSISNHGTSGSLVAAPIIINQPQSAILGIGKLEQRVVVGAGGGVEVRPMVYVTLTIDHRVLDGFQANAFLTRWTETIQQTDW
ncbi:MAG: dihydrolipoamide acetyltransferase family protein [Gemmatimonadales bacterium]